MIHCCVLSSPPCCVPIHFLPGSRPMVETPASQAPYMKGVSYIWVCMAGLYKAIPMKLNHISCKFGGLWVVGDCSSWLSITELGGPAEASRAERSKGGFDTDSSRKSAELVERDEWVGFRSAWGGCVDCNLQREVSDCRLREVSASQTTSTWHNIFRNQIGR